MQQKEVLIVGGGFGGIKAALELADDHRVHVTLLSDWPNFRYYPSLYHTATGGQAAGSSIPLAAIFAGKPVKLVDGRAKSLDRASKTLTTTNHKTYHYDILILALGVVTNYFGIKGLEEYSYGIKSLNDAEEFKQHLHKQLIDTHQPDLHYVVVGGGATGIELAGALPAYLRHIMKNHGIRHRAIHIDLVEAAPHLMPRMPKRIGKKIERRLRSLGIKLYLGQAVQGETADALTVNGKPITSHTVVWTAGVTNNPFFKDNNFKLTDHGKVVIDNYLQAEPEIFVLGDNADTPYSGMAQTAVFDGKFISNAIKRDLAGQAVAPYQPRKPVYVTPVGPHWAAVLWGKAQLYGWHGWVLHELANFVAFHDLEPWWKASQQWMTEFGEEENCPICAHLTA